MKTKELKRNKGITLIALVITIIVLLILAGISIAMLTGENGLVTKAGNAKEETRGASVKEAVDLWKINKNVDNYTENITAQSKKDLLDELEAQKLLVGNERSRLEEGEVIRIGTKEISLEEKTLADELKVGDYVKYGDKLTAITYETKVDETGYETSQTFQTNKSMLWRVINKKANGDVEIVAVSNTLATDGNTGLYLKGQTGFLNAETVLNNLCDKLYTNTSYGYARSIKMDDIDGLTGFNPLTSDWDGKDYYINNRNKTYTSGTFWDKNSNTFKIASNANPITVENSSYYYIIDENTSLYDTLIAESKTYNGDYSEKNYPKFYWFGSCSASTHDDEAYFYVNALLNGTVVNDGLFYANVDGTTREYNEIAQGVRPMVTLKSGVQIDKSDNSKDGSSPTNAWNLK